MAVSGSTAGRISASSSPTSNKTVGDARVSEDRLEGINHSSLARKRPLLLHNLLIFLVYLLLVLTNVLERLDASFSQFRPISQVRSCYGALHRLRFLKDALLPNLNKSVDSELLIMKIQQLEDIFSIVQYARICTLG